MSERSKETGDLVDDKAFLEGLKALALAAGFHRHLTKPVDIDVLLQALREGPAGAAPWQEPEPEPLVLS